MPRRPATTSGPRPRRFAPGLRAWLVVLVAVCVVPFLVLFFVRAGDARNQARDAVSADTLRLSRIAALESATVLDEVRLALTALRTTAMPGASDPCTIVGDVVAQVADTTPFALDANGAPRCGSDVVAGLAPDDPALAAARRDGFAFARLGPAPGTTLVGLVSLPAPGDFAYAGARIELGSALSGLGQQLGLPDDATVFVVDETGATIAAGTPGTPAAGATGTELVDQVAAGAVEGTFDEPAGRAGPDGVGRVVSYADIGEPGLGLYAVLGLPTATAFASADRQLRANLVVTFVVALVALAAAGAVAELSLRRPFRRLLRTVRRLGEGQLGARSGLAESRTTEVNELARAIDHMATNLEERDENLRAMAEERQRLLGQIVEAHETERRRIAADIHDDTVQAVTAVGLQLQLVRRKLRDQVSPDVEERFDKLQDHVVTAGRSLRSLMFELDPASGGDQGLDTSLRQYLVPVLDEAPLELEIDAAGVAEPTGAVRAVLYRNVREIVGNARKHAHAARVVVTVADEDDGLAVRVVDDGAGFDPSIPTPGHHGLRLMRQRTEALGGRLTLTSAPGAGTVVAFWLPRAEASEEP